MAGTQTQPKPSLQRTCVAYYQDGGAVKLLSSKGAEVQQRNPEKATEVLQTFTTDGAVNDLYIATDGHFVAAQEDQYVKTYKLSDGSFERICTRMPLPARAVAGDEAYLLTAGDGEGIKMMSCKKDYQVVRTLRDVSYVRSIALDPDGQFVAASTVDGVLAVWDLVSGVRLLHMKKAVPKVNPESSAVNGIAFHPDGGSLLAAPGQASDVVFYERLSWEEVFTLSGGHTANINTLAFSPNGLYLVTSGQDFKLLLWDIPGRKAIATKECSALVCSISWHPESNVLVWSDMGGNVGEWKNLVPTNLPGPAEPTDVIDAREDAAAAAALEAAAAASTQDMSGLDNESGAVGSPEGPSGSPAGPSGRGRGAPAPVRTAAAAKLPKAQRTFQPGATPLGDNERRFLAYTLEGCITCKADGDINIIEVVFHDTLKYKRRIPLLQDFHGINMASLGAKGALYASPSSEDNPAMVLYRPFEAWASHSDWAFQLPKGEEPVAVAAGSSFCAIATSTGYLRIMSQSGAQLHVMSLLSPHVVAMAAQEHCLAITYAASVRNKSEMTLEYVIYDISRLELLHQGPLPLTPGSQLSWLGFVERTPLLAAQDSTGVIRVRGRQFGGCWTPIFVADTERQGTEDFWVVGMTRSQLSCVICTYGGLPQVHPRPVVTLLPLKVPVLEGDLQEAENEADNIRDTLWLQDARMQCAEGRMQGSPASGELAFQEARLEAEVDRRLLKLINAALKNDKAGRAYELAAQLNLEKSLAGALRLANHFRMQPLAERIAQLIDMRQQEDAEQMVAEEITPVPVLNFQAMDADAQQQEPAQAAADENADPQEGAAEAAEEPAKQLPNAFSRLGPSTKPAATTGGSTDAAKRKAPATQSANPFARKQKVAK